MCDMGESLHSTDVSRARESCTGLVESSMMRTALVQSGGCADTKKWAPATMTTGIILCVDDDTTVLKALRTLLGSMLGSDNVIEIAESGQEALELCDDLQKEGRELTLVISDFIMPGMRGDELLVRLHEKSPKTIKIMLTGQSDLTGVKRAINEANLYRFLEKPFNNADLVLTAKSAVHAYKQERGLILQIETLKKENAELNRMLAQTST